jgi:hypothetical protein
MLSGSRRLAVAHEDLEGVELRLGIVPARMQAVEVGSAVDAEQHGLAIEDKRAATVAQRGQG